MRSSRACAPPWWLALHGAWQPQLEGLISCTSATEYYHPLQGLALFRGGVLMVSHDQHLIESTVDELWAVEQGTGAILLIGLASQDAEWNSMPELP